MIAITFVDRLEDFARDELLQIVLIIIGTLLAVRLLRWVIGRVEARLESRQGGPEPALVPTEEAKRRNALFGVATYIGTILVWSVGGFMLLDRVGVNTGPLVASAGVVGLAVGFGAQSLVRDVVTGFFVIAENQYGVGDVIQVNGDPELSGTVERVTLRTTVMRTIAGEAVIVPNGEIKNVINKTKEWSRAVVDVALLYGTDLADAFAALDAATKELKDDPDIGPYLLADPEVWGVESLGDATLRVRVVARTLPLKQWEVARRLRALIVGALGDRGIGLPHLVMPAVAAAQPAPSSRKRR